MKILGIETSCDETAAAVVEKGPSTSSGLRIFSNVVASSKEIHAKTGGIIPEVAAREQVKWIIPVINEAIEQLNSETIDALAVTVGPGLIGSLLVGVETAKTLAYVWDKPIVPVNHLQAHLYANWLANSSKLVPPSGTSDQPSEAIPQFPAIGLVVSGGHTDLVLMKDHPSKSRDKLQWLGGTRDDAAGECFDKCARILGLGFPGGPAIEKIASTIHYPPLNQSKHGSGQTSTIHLPRPMIKQKNYDFSFSGLKTAVLRLAQKPGIAQFIARPSTISGQAKRGLKSANPTTANLAAEIQEAIVEVLVKKTIRAAKEHKVKSILLAGGVAANTLLRKQLEMKILRDEDMKLFVPSKSLCTDNAAIAASWAHFNFRPFPWSKIKALPDLRIQDLV